MNSDVRDRLQRLVPAEAAPIRVSPARTRDLGPVARIVALGSGRVLGSEPANVFRVLGRNARLFRVWILWSGTLMRGGRLPGRDAELVILRVAYRTGAAYEWHQHVVMGARAGLGEDEIARAAAEDLEGWTPRQAMLVTAVDELLSQSRLSDTTWAAVARELGDKGAIELCLLVGQYQGLATALGGLGVPVERR